MFDMFGTAAALEAEYAKGLLARLVDDDPTDCNDDCFWCERPLTRIMWGQPWVTVHDASCAWVDALRFLGRELPRGHKV